MKHCVQHLWKTLPLITILLLQGSLHVQAQPVSREYQLKAVFLFHFTQFTDWPARSFDGIQSPLVIGVLGENPFGAYLEQIVSGEKLSGHTVIVHYYKNAEDIGPCHILFINLSDAKKRKEIITALKGKSILTVSDAPGFAQEGGMIRLFTKDNKIKLQINLEASRAGGLVISSKLLRLAEIFNPGENN